MKPFSVEELRAEFDQSFTLPPRVERPRDTEFLLVSLGGSRYALNTETIRSVVRKPYVRAIPMAHPAGVGVLSHRGMVFVALSLSRLLGLSPETAEEVALLTESDVAVLVPELRHAEAAYTIPTVTISFENQLFKVLDVGQLLAGTLADTTEVSTK